jgi:hypothetical protein
VLHSYTRAQGVKKIASDNIVNTVKPARVIDGKIDWTGLMCTCGTTLEKIKKYSGHKEGGVVKCTNREYKNTGCTKDHHIHWECPKKGVDAPATTHI